MGCGCYRICRGRGVRHGGHWDINSILRSLPKEFNYMSGDTPACFRVSASPGVRLVTIRPGNVKLISTSVWVLIAWVVGPVHAKTEPLTIITGSQVRVIGSLAQLFAMADRVIVYGVAVRRSARFAGVCNLLESGVDGPTGELIPVRLHVALELDRLRLEDDTCA